MRRAGESGSHPLPGQVTGARHIWGSGRTGLTGDLRLEGSLTFAFPGECDQPTWAGQQGWEHAWDSSPLSTRLQGTLEFLPCLGGGGLCLSAAEDLLQRWERRVWVVHRQLHTYYTGLPCTSVLLPLTHLLGSSCQARLRSLEDAE